MNREKLRALFNACDIDGSGFIGLEEVRSICAQYQIEAEDADMVFRDLDCDGDGQISYDDFCAGFLKTESASNGKEERLINGRKLSECFGIDPNDSSDSIRLRRPNSSEARNIMCQIESPLFGNIDSQEIISELWEKYHKLQEENKSLQQSWLREKRDHEVHLHQIEQELDSQVREVESRVRQHAKEEIEADRKHFREMVKEEMNEIQAHISMFEKVDAWLKSNAENNNNAQDGKLNELKEELRQALQENRQMRLALLETQATVAMMASDVAELRNNQKTKDRHDAFDSDEERTQLVNQLQVLQDANKRLKDTHDALRCSIDLKKPELSEAIYAQSYDKSRHRGSVIGDYIDRSKTARRQPYTLPITEGGENQTSQRSTSDTYSRNGVGTNRHLGDSNYSDGPDSGISSNVRDDLFDDRHSDSMSGPYSSPTYLINNNYHNLYQTKSSENSCMQGEEIDNSGCLAKTCTSKERQESNQDLTVMDANGPPERAFNIIFIGDACVGKTSFISRIVKNVFVNELSATLGIDFHVKTLNVLGKNVTLQLWDTAGQERFRSVTKSYFRKADGIILVYDVTNESSFLSVREWMSAIENINGSSVPVVMVANKTDLRQETNEAHVTTASGRKISDQYKVPIFEASVKDGSNVLNSIGQLTKLMLENERKLIRSSGLTLTKNEKKFMCCK